MLTLFIFLLLLSILVLVHEFGHLLMALRSGAKVEEFALGLPFTKPIISRPFQISNFKFQISLYPILFGGFVKIYGEEDNHKENYAFGNLSRLKRSLIIISGVTMNFLLAWLLISFLLTQGVPKPHSVTITEVAADSPAQNAGLKTGEKIILINNKNIDSVEQVISETAKQKVMVITLDNTKTITVEPRKNPPPGQGPLGIGLRQEWREVKYLWYEAPIFGFGETVNLGKRMVAGLGQILFQLIKQGRAPEGVAGPLGIAALTREAVSYGYKAVLELTAVLSLNLAIINILPFPALDGGRLVFVGLEGLMGKKRREKWEKRVNSLGMILLLGLMFLITLNDISRILPK